MKRDPNSGLGMLFDALKDSGVDMDNLKDMANPMKPAGASKKAQEEEIASEVDEILEDVVEEVEEESGSGMPFEKPSYNHKNKKGKGKGTDGPAATLIEDIAEWSKKRLILAIIIAVIVLAGAYWWFHPAINIHSADFWFPVLVIAFLLFTFFKIKGRLAAAGTKRTEKNEGKAKTFKVLSYIPLLVIAAWAIGYVMTFSVFPGNAEKYANILKIETEDFAEDIQEVNYSQIPVIDRSTASLLANKEMGTISEYVSQFEISPLFSQINYKGAPVRVSPLGYADLFKWLTNRNPGIPAYSLVDMTTQNAQIVTLPVGSEIKYSASEPLARNIDRYVQLKYPFYMFDEKSFEIDDNGHPWWICPVQDYTIGLFGGCTISRAVLVDASTGECFDYDIKDVPQWVDHVFPAELLIQQYNWHGSLLNGWFNSWLGQAGVTQTTPGNNGQSGYNYIAKDDDVWVYTGVTSVTSDNSIIGFMLVNQRTQEAHFYSVAGATETAAMSSAEGQVQSRPGILELRPENSRRIQKLHAVFQLQPLLPSGNPGPVTGFGALVACHPVYQ